MARSSEDVVARSCSDHSVAVPARARLRKLRRVLFTPRLLIAESRAYRRLAPGAMSAQNPNPAMHDSSLQGRMIFNLGARRSGTFWLQRIVCAHSDVAEIPSETHLFSH